MSEPEPVQRPHPSHLFDSDGLLLRRDAVRMGVDDKALARLVDSRVLVKLRHGLYCSAPVFTRADDRERHRLLCLGVMRQYADHVALSHGSACIVQGGPAYGLALGSAHLTHLSGGGRQQSRIRHHSGVCLVGDVRRHDDFWITTPARSVADTTCTDGVVAGLVQANHFLHAGLTDPEELVAMFERSRHWPGSLHQHPVLLLADAQIESVGESRSIHCFFTQGLPRPVLQHVVHDPATNTSYRVDFAWPERRVIVEFDGAEKYHRFRRDGETIAQMVAREKSREDRIRELTGWIVIRITWHDLDLPINVGHRIRRAFTMAAGPRLAEASGF